METKLSTWLITELNQREWSQRELARRSGLSHTAINKVLTGQQPATLDICTKIAYSFGERPEKVLRIAGLLPPTAGPAELSLDEAQLIELYRSADPDDRAMILDVVTRLLKR